MKDTIVGVILAGGKGTRLSPITRAVPKELLTIGDKPVIDYVIEQMKCAGITKIYVVIGYRKEVIINYLGSGKRYSVQIGYVYQEEPLGNANAVLQVEPFIEKTFCVVFGDEYLEPNTAVKRLIEYHFKNSGEATVGVIQVEDARITSIVRVDKDNRLLDIVEKPKSKEFWTNLGENGTHVFEPIVFDYIRKTKPGLNGEYYLSDVVKNMALEGRKVYAIKNADFHLDIGVKERYYEANIRTFNKLEAIEKRGRGS